MMDTERGNGDGHETVERFRAANSCGSTSMPYSDVAGCQSGATSVEPGLRDLRWLRGDHDLVLAQ